MSYYPAERRGGCMETLTGCCRQVYVYPVDSRKLLYAAGAIAGIVLVAVVWSGLSSSNSASHSEALKGRTVIQESPLIVGCNFFPSNLRDLAHNNVTRVKFNQNLKNDSLFGNSACSTCQTDLLRLKSGLVGTQIWSINVPCSAMYKDAVSLTLEQVDSVTRLINSYPDSLTLIKSSSDVTGGFKNKLVGSMLAVTSGLSLDGRLGVLRSLYSLGVRVVALTSNCPNLTWASSYIDEKDTGLSDFGKALVKEMNRLGIVIDLSQASYKTQLDVLNITKAPVIFSHAAAYALNNDSRNIKDDILVKLKFNKGLLMVTFAQKYLSNNVTDASVNKVIEHINYIKEIVGVNGVGIGAEFDASGETYPPLLNDVSTFPALFDQLAKNWTNQEDLKKLAGGNFLRVFQAVEQYANNSSSLPADETYTLQTNSTCYSDFKTRQYISGDNKTVTTTTTVEKTGETTAQTTLPTATSTLAPTTTSTDNSTSTSNVQSHS